MLRQLFSVRNNGTCVLFGVTFSLLQLPKVSIVLWMGNDMRRGGGKMREITYETFDGGCRL